MTFVVIYDSSVLHGAVGDLLLRLAARPTIVPSTFPGPAFHARWSQQIVDESVEELRRRHPLLDPEVLRQRFVWMSEGIDLVTGHEQLTPAVDLPRPDRWHVLAAAIRCDAQAIITWSPYDFPESTLRRYDHLEALDPDIFVVNQFDHDSAAVWTVCQEQTAALRRRTLDELFDSLHAEGLVKAVTMLRQFREAASRSRITAETVSGISTASVGHDRRSRTE
jgi:hypothetical protein